MDPNNGDIESSQEALELKLPEQSAKSLLRQKSQGLAPPTSMKSRSRELEPDLSPPPSPSPEENEDEAVDTISPVNTSLKDGVAATIKTFDGRRAEKLFQKANNAKEYALEQAKFAEEGVKSSILFGKWFPWLILFRELVIDGIPIFIFATQLLAIAITADDVAREHVPYCDNEVIQDIGSRTVAIANNAALGRFWDPKDDISFARNYEFAICDQASLDRGDYICSEKLHCTPPSTTTRLWVDYDEPERDDDSALKEIFFIIIFFVPFLYACFVMYYWRVFFAKERLLGEVEPTLGDLYHGEMFWQRTARIWKYEKTYASWFQLYLSVFCIFGVVFATWHFNDEAGQRIGKEIVRVTIYALIIAFFAIFSLNQPSAATFWSEDYNEFSMVTEEEYKNIRTRLAQVPLEALALDWKAYFTKDSGTLIFEAEQNALIFLQTPMAGGPEGEEQAPMKQEETSLGSGDDSGKTETLPTSPDKFWSARDVATAEADC